MLLTRSGGGPFPERQQVETQLGACHVEGLGPTAANWGQGVKRCRRGFAVYHSEAQIGTALLGKPGPLLIAAQQDTGDLQPDERLVAWLDRVRKLKHVDVVDLTVLMGTWSAIAIKSSRDLSLKYIVNYLEMQ